MRVRHLGPEHPHPPRKTSIATTTERIRVASIPAAHPYVHAISDPLRVQVLPDPPVPGAPSGQWWPPVAMTPAWIDDNADAFDVLHVHFGLESFSPAELSAALDAARRAGRAVVYTVHDLDNPQLEAQGHHRALLDVIVPAADRLLTLTVPAASEIEHRWGRASTVLPHPTLLTGIPSASAAASDSLADVVRVGMHLRDLRPNIDAERAVRAAVRAVRLLGDHRAVHVDVLLNERVRDEATAVRIAAAIDAPRVDLRRTPRLSDAGIEQWLRGLDVFVLPYRHGTHSGWVELCHDLGVRVAGTDVGHVGAQHPAGFSVIDLDDPLTLADAVRNTPLTRGDEREALLRTRRRERLAERDGVRAAHAALYASAIAEVSA
ncbi:hypothetical protein [Microbacterium galbinum]|uniref:hypothetical protein n=1 Tax=Microbacterium galbinum TaxID=2851646 RepID=UPI001FFC5AFF|nr:hypothetical protein [Microbacterium galbinum]MCK2030658.1 glycosyltransferase [Microbacterium galbinum]